MQDKYLDEYFRNRLDQWDLPPDADAWEQFEAAQDAAFDAQIRSSLTSLTQPESPEDWPLLASRLEGAMLDASVFEVLESYHAPYHPAAWLSMLDRLAQPAEAAIRSALARYTPRRRRRDWHRMAQLLDAEYPAARTVRRPHALRLTLIMLLLAAAWLPLHTLRRERQLQIRQAVFVQPPASPAAVSGRIPAPQAPASLALAAQQPAPAAEAAAVPPGFTPPVQPEARPETPARQIQAIAPAAPAPGWEPDPAFRPAAHRRRHTLTGLKLGLYAANTATRAELSGPPAPPGFTAGIRVEKEIRKGWSLVSGLMLSRKQFSYEYYVILDRSYPHAIDGRLTLLEAPLLVRYRFAANRNPQSNIWLYAQGGMVTALSLSEEYQHFDPTNPVNGGIPLAQPRLLKPAEYRRSLITYPGNVFFSIGTELKLSSRFTFQVEPYVQQSLQRTKGSGAIGLEKKLYTWGIGATASYSLW